jgi:hypothetical protein
LQHRDFLRGLFVMRCALTRIMLFPSRSFKAALGLTGNAGQGEDFFAGQQVRRSRGSRRSPDERSDIRVFALSIPHIVMCQQTDEIMIRFNLIGS